MQSGIKELGLTRFSDAIFERFLVQYAMIFYNSVAAKFCGLDTSLCFSVFDSKVGFTPSVFKNDTSDYSCKKYSKNNCKRVLICNKKSYIYKWTEMAIWKVEVLGY